MGPDGTPSIVADVRTFVEQEVVPVARALDHADTYPHDLVARMRALGLFGALVPRAYGGLGLDVATYARVIEELCRGWMSLAGVINSHTMAALIVLGHGTEEQRQRFLPRLARGEARGGLALTEPHAGSDVQAIRTVARRQGDLYLVTGSKMFITNGREGNTLALLALTDPAARPSHRGMSCFIVEKGAPGLRVVKSIAKLGYKGVDTVELLFEDCPVPAANLVGGVEGRGFKQVMDGLETGRINIAARAVGVAQGAWEEARDRVRAGQAPCSPRLADMAAKVGAARRLTAWAAAMKDRGQRCDLEAGMAKLYASEIAHQVAGDALRVEGEAGQLETASAERHYRDTPLMIIGEGTNEIQRQIIARQLLARHGERLGALVSREDEPAERRQLVLAVRQLVEREVVPAAGSDVYPITLVARLAELGVLGATAGPDDGGLGLDLWTCAMLVEEIARASGTLAAIAVTHLAAARALAARGTRAQRDRVLAPMTRGEILGTVAAAGELTAARDGRGWRLDGRLRLVENATHVAGLLAGVEEADACVLVGLDAPGITVEPPRAGLGMRGLDLCDVVLRGARVEPWAILDGRGALEDATAVARLGVAAMAVGVAQAAFEAALRYSQQRSTFGKRLCEHQAVQLKLADMATAITAARLATYDAARRLEAGENDTAVRMARVLATEAAAEATLESMRIHGGYGYSAEFPVERYYRDAARLLVVLGGNDAERAQVAARLGGVAAAEPIVART